VVPGAASPVADADRYIDILRFTHGLQEVDMMGAGCLLVRRDVFERLSPPWFDFTINQETDAIIHSEDTSFCEQARAAGFPLLLDGDVQCEHVATRYVGMEDWIAAMQHGGLSAVLSSVSKEDFQLAQEVRPWPRPPVPASAPTQRR
jgi:hypothetical protein